MKPALQLAAFAGPITPQTTLAELEQWANSVRDWPCKPTSIGIKFLAYSRTWNATLFMVNQEPIIGVGRDVVTAINDALGKAKQ